MYMKTLSILLISLFFSLGTFSQVSENQARISELKQSIEKVAANSEYRLAGEYQSELRIREEIEKALDNGDIHLAGRLQAKLERKEYLVPTTSKYKPPTHLEKAERRRTYFFVDVITMGYNNYYSEFTYFDGLSYYTPIERVNSFTVGYNIGQHFYFGPPKNGLRFGLSMNYIGLSAMRFGAFVSGANYNLFRPGVVINKFFNEDIGIDFSVHFGTTLLDSGSSTAPNNIYALSFSPHVKFWYKNLTVGLQYNYASMIYYNATLNNLNFTVGACF